MDATRSHQLIKDRGGIRSGLDRRQPSNTTVAPAVTAAAVGTAGKFPPIRLSSFSNQPACAGRIAPQSRVI